MRMRLAKSVADAGWSQLMRCIQQKAAQYGREFSKIGRFEPTSQVCSGCGVKDHYSWWRAALKQEPTGA
jgi:putative transposase